MPSPPYAIPEHSLVLVTAANSYIGSNIVDILFTLGFRVRGTIRGGKPWLNNLFEKRHGKGRFETVVIPGAEQDGVFEGLLQDVTGIIHVASDVSMDPDPDAVIPKVRRGTLNPLVAASKQPSVKRFVLTSSSSAPIYPTPNKAIAVDEDSWDDFAVRAAYDNNTSVEERPFLVYAASKTEGERAAWKFVEERRPEFILNGVLPNMAWGRILSPEIPGSTMGWTRDLLKGNDQVMKLMAPQWYVDVQDAARLHVVALLDPNVQQERIFAFAGPFNWTDVIKTLRELRPHLVGTIPEPPKDEPRDLCDIRGSKRAEQLLKDFFGRESFTSMKESLAEGIAEIK